MKEVKFISDKPNIVWCNIINIDSNRLDADYFKKKYLESQMFLMKSGLNLVKLYVIASLITQGPNPKFNDNKEGIPCLKTRNIYDEEISFDDCNYISLEEYNKYHKFQLQHEDILVSILGEGSIGKCNIYTSNEKALFNRPIGLIRIKKGQVDRFFVSIYLRSKYGKDFLDRGISGSSGQKVLSIEHIKNILVPIPSPEIQKYIGDKVRKAEELREEAKTLQKEIDILLEVDMLLKEETDNVYNIYDSKINWTNEITIEDRIDPNFYQKKYISTIEKLGNNKVRLEKYVRITKRRYQTGDINKYIEISSINNRFGTIDEVEELRPEEIPTSAKYQVKEGDILVSLVRPTRKAISIVTKEYDNAICTGGFAVLLSKGKVPVEFLTAVLRTNFVGIQFERYCAGSTYPTINEDDILKVFIPMYSENQINKIAENYRRIIDNIYTSKKLIQEAKQDVEDLIEGNFDMSKIKAHS